MRTIFCAGRIYDGDRLWRDYAVSVVNGAVETVGPVAKLTAEHPEADIVQKETWFLLPGLIDAHDHGRALSPLAFGVLDRSLERWIPELCKVPPVSAYALALFDGLQLACSGVSTVLHCHNAADWQSIESELTETVRGYNDAGIRVALCPPYIEQNSLIYYGREAFLSALPADLRGEAMSLICDRPYSLDCYFEMLDRLAEKLRPQREAGMANILLHPVGGQWCGDESLLRIKAYSRTHAMPVHMHLLETRYQKIW
ncbi:MAG: amidohydrolase family protein [Clostridiales Family XIII bacterium]|jgi:cytosine/adenosine deaminase-related metal-dependent hydrolase|nr:amidohydrolase family protein [Clostridiales Family XIII bacterium]